MAAKQLRKHLLLLLFTFALMKYASSFGTALRLSWLDTSSAVLYKSTKLLSTTGRASAAVSQEASKLKTNVTRSAKLDLNPPKGTRDFFPEDKRLSNWLFAKFRSVATRYGFEEYDSPVVESEDLYVRKAGEEVTEQAS